MKRGNTMKRSTMKGSSMIEILLVSAAIVIIGGLGVTQGIKFMDNQRANDAIVAEDTIAKACAQAIATDASIVRLYPDSSYTRAKDISDKFVERINEYIDGDMKIVYYDGTTVPSGLQADGLTGVAGWYVTRLDKWKLHYRVEFHSDDNGFTGESLQTKGPRIQNPSYSVSSNSNSSDVSHDSELRVYIKSLGRNGETPAGDFMVDNDDIYTMYQFVNTEFDKAAVIRNAKSVSSPALVVMAHSADSQPNDGTTGIYSIYTQCEGGRGPVFVSTALKNSADKSTTTCVVSNASYTAGKTSIRTTAIAKAK